MFSSSKLFFLLNFRQKIKNKSATINFFGVLFFQSNIELPSKIGAITWFENKSARLDCVLELPLDK